MELWIRSQDKKTLVQVDGLKIWAFEDDDTIDIQAKRGDYLGEYKTKERALEILDEIQDLMRSLTDSDLKIIQYEMPSE